ncbi:type VI secretion system-associated FHA domain protein TagH [Xenorhabdus littoralis]|uniref:type VI secretion system-associated FHA domain protein TagH n=1 Tax=Xenorhabdus littoralis TaxID=2582835 RepID=UPI0029E82335|nr:type VI secretion system-associated FHA domain protein TagH [Xenorhabdus sp. psl]
MMMRFSIVKNSGTNQPSQLSYDFSPPGGTIGRSTDNNWILPDEELTIARLQAVVSITADGECRINNQGSASEILLNMIPLAPERQVEIRDGDRLDIGSYQIKVMNVDKTPLSPLNRNQPENTNGIWDDLEQILAASDTFSSQEKPPATQEKEWNNNNPPVNHSPVNHSPVNPLVKESQHRERNPIDPLAQIERATDLESLQLRPTDPMSMFNSDTTFQQENILNDHTPTTLLQRDKQYEHQDDDKKEIDPLVLFSDKHTQHAKDKDDDLFNQILDNAVPLNSLHDATTSESQWVPEFQATEKNIKETARTPDQSINNHHESHNHQTHEVKLEEQPEGKLLAALLDGMGLKDLHRLQFDEQFMYQLGRLVSQLSQGIISLNATRNLLKRKLDAETDMVRILPDLHNPFKLLPSAQSVLAMILSGHMPGFMPLEEATRDILTELQAHQLGMVAGMRTTAADILHLFNPAILEQTAQDDGYLSRLSFSSTNKAFMWDYFTKYYRAKTGQFEHDSALFSDNFLQAYDAEVERYKNSQSRTPK